MSLRNKTLALVGATFIILMIIVWLLLKNIFLENLIATEKKLVQDDVARTVNALRNEENSLQAVTSDWAYWDDACDFMAGQDRSFVETNLIDASFSYLKVNLIVFIDRSGRVVFSKAFDMTNNKAVPVHQSLPGFIQLHPDLMRSDSARNPTSGLLTLPETSLLISSCPILPTSQTGPVQGTLIMGRNIDSAFISRLSKTTELDLSLNRLAGVEHMPEYQAVVKPDDPQNPPYVVQALNADYAAGYTILKNIFGQPAFALKVTVPRSVYQHGQATIYSAALMVLFIALFFGGLILFILERLILSRLYRLSTEVNSIGDDDFHCRVRKDKDDELGSLAAAINHMLGQLEHSHLRLLDSDNRLRSITDNMLDVVCQVDKDSLIRYCSPSYKKVLGEIVRDMGGRNLLSLAHPEDQERVEMTVKQVIKTGLPAYFEFRCLKEDRTYIWLETMVNAICDSNRDVSGAVLVARDVTQRKAAEDRIKFMSLHDSLTGMYNRTYFEQEMMTLEGPESLPVALMICDLDGLKFINDTLGHKTGDALLAKAALILTECCPDSIIARIGGDEFAVLFERCNRSQVESVYSSIKRSVAEHCSSSPELPLAISVGFALRYESSFSMADLFREADNNMYREKLHSQRSGHSGLVSSLMQALQERDFVTSGHGERLDRLVKGLGLASGLSFNRLHDLRLFTRFHDIGKVAIPDFILLKPGPLTPDEYAAMQRHCEVGYRIARAAVDLQPVAEWILKHHEWWNGHGYPLGLAGEEIPVECRILAIVDAYDAMTSDRPYRKAMTREEALEELRRCSGAQFDPDLVATFMGLVDDLEQAAVNQ